MLKVKDKYKCENCEGNELTAIVKTHINISEFPIEKNGLLFRNCLDESIIEENHDTIMEFVCLNCGHPYADGDMFDIIKWLSNKE